MRSSLWDERGRSQGEAAQLEHRARSAPDGTAELDPEALLERVAQAIDAAMEDAPEIEAVATSTFWHALLGLGDDGRPRDARSTRGPTGGRPRRRRACAASSTRTRCTRARAAACTRATGPRSWRGCARPTRSASSACAPGSRPASTCSGGCSATRPRASRWPPAPGCSTSAPAAGTPSSTRGIEDRLPPIDDTPRSGLEPEWAERWPALRDVPWFPAWGDGACSNLGSGCGTLEPRGADGRHERRAARALAHRGGAGDHARPVALPRRRRSAS